MGKMRGGERFGDEQFHRSPEKLVPRPAESRLGLRIGVPDDACRVDPNDRIGPGFEDRQSLLADHEQQAGGGRAAGWRGITTSIVTLRRYGFTYPILRMRPSGKTAAGLFGLDSVSDARLGDDQPGGGAR